jgi:hypothetical protein
MNQDVHRPEAIADSVDQLFEGLTIGDGRSNG